MEQSFASGLNFYKIFWIFFIGCFLGVVIESVWCVIRLKRLESRKGLIYGPFNPVYGFGALLMTVTLSRLNSERDLCVFICGAIMGGVYEYVCSVIQEKLFGSVSWDYKKVPLNLNGRINLLYCFFWGFLSLLWVKNIYPPISMIIEMIPNEYGIALTWLCLIFFVCDGFISACAVYRMSKRLKGEYAVSNFWKYIDKHYPDEKVKKVYPNMKFNPVGFRSAK